MTTFTTEDRIGAQRVPLTDDEIIELYAAINGRGIIEFARAIERAHGIGE